MKILLAPMEGVVDPVVRDLFTSLGGIDYCVTEFVRITSSLYPDKVFYRYCPELKNNSRTSSGVPVFTQLLGSDLVTMAENAHKVCELGAYGIDLNFGCPAKTVNRHDGGAALLKNPDRLFKVVESVRKAVPKERPVTVKVRLGYSDKSLTHEIAQAAQEGGGHWLTVHARTKEEAYRPPAHWKYIAQMKEQVSIPVIANGDIWTVDDHKRCQEISHCEDTMLGRGIMAQPDLARQIKLGEPARTFEQLKELILKFIEQSFSYRDERYTVQRTKQFIKLLGRTYPQAQLLFESFKREKEIEKIKSIIQSFFLNNDSRPSQDKSS